MRQILQDYLAVPVRIDQFVGRWDTVPPEGRTLLGLGQGGLLGQSAMLGDRVVQLLSPVLDCYLIEGENGHVVTVGHRYARVRKS